jgi:hypothetical protein
MRRAIPCLSTRPPNAPLHNTAVRGGPRLSVTPLPESDLSASFLSPRTSKLKDIRQFMVFCVLFSGVALLLSCLALSRDRSELRREIADNFASGALVAQVYIGRDARRGRYLANDCLILQTLIAGHGPVLADAVNSPVSADSSTGACEQLNDLSSDAEKATYAYSRYFFGAKTFAGLGMKFASLDVIKHGLRVAVYVTLLAAGALAAAFAVRGGQNPRGLYVTVLVAVIGLLTVYDLRYFSVTLAHGFSEWVLAGYLLYSVLARPVPETSSLPWRIVVLGCLTAWFELLSGPMVMAIGLAMLVENAGDRVGAPRRALRAGWVAGAAVIACFLALQLFVALFGDAHNVLQFFYHAALRMQLHRLLDLPVETNWQIAENLRSYTAADVYAAVTGALPGLTRGNTVAAYGVFAGSVVCLAAAFVAAHLRKEAMRSFLVYLLVPLIVVAWFLLLSNHTVIHAWAIVRIMALWPICAVLAVAHAFSPPGWWPATRAGSLA